MRLPGLVRVAAAATCCLLAETASARADETFLCADGTSLTIDDSNRAELQEHPCIKAWFVADRARRQAHVGDEEGTSAAKSQPTVHRYTVQRAMALRDLQRRPAYLAWARARTAEARVYGRSRGTLARTHVRTVRTGTGATFRIRLGRR